MPSVFADQSDDPAAPTLSVAGHPVVSGGGSTITVSGSYTDSVTVGSITVYCNGDLVGVATIDPVNQTWSLTTDFAAGSYDRFFIVLIDQQDGSATTLTPYSVRTGVTGQFYVTEETDYVNNSIASEIFYKSDASIYKINTFDAAGHLISEHYYNYIGADFTSYEIDYDASGNIYKKIYYGYTDKSYVTAVYNYDYNSQTSTYRLNNVQYLNADGSVNEEIVYAVTGGYSITYYGVTGRPFTSYEIDYDGSSHFQAIKYFGLSGEPYVSEERDYDWSSTSLAYTLNQILFTDNAGNVMEKIVYDADGGRVATVYDIQGKPFTSREADYDADNHYTSLKYFGFTGLSYASSQYDYVWSSATSQEVPVDAFFFRGDGSLAGKIVYRSDGGHDNTTYVVGKPFASYEIDYDSSGHYTAIKYAGYTGQPYTSAQFDFSWSDANTNYSPIDKLFFSANGDIVRKNVYAADGSHVDTLYDITGQPFTSREVDYDANNHYTSLKYFGFTDLFYSSLQYDYTWSSATSQEVLVDMLFFRSDGSLAQKIVYNPDGSHETVHYALGGAPHST